MWASTVLANGSIYGLVIYTGLETRMAMNSRTPKTKVGRIDGIDTPLVRRDQLFIDLTLRGYGAAFASHNIPQLTAS